jgi:putative ribosome biogenesis GTPase RsgA
MIRKNRTSTAAPPRGRPPSRRARQAQASKSEDETASLPRNLSVVVVMGVSGCGKSTIASMLAHRLNWIYDMATGSIRGPTSGRCTPASR